MCAATSYLRRILLFSRDPGGANTLIPLVAPLRQKGFDVRLYGKDVALERFGQAGLAPINILDAVHSLLPEEIEALLRDEHPDFVITGTSAEDFTERYLWRAAERLGIPSFAILDQWINYGIRFSPWDVSNTSQYEAAPEHSFLPSRIIVMDEFARDEMIKVVITERDRILPLGQPYFETLFNRYEALPAIEASRKRLAVEDGAFVITYVSEPLSRDYRDDGAYWGFTEHTIFISLRNAICRVAEQVGKRVHLIVKLHPRENRDNYDDLLSHCSALVTTVVDSGGDSMELIHVSDLICGMSSMMLIEAAIIGKPVLSLLIGLRRESPFVLDRRDIIRSARSEAEAEDLLLKAFASDLPSLGKFMVIKEPVRNIIDEMERMLS